MTVGAVAGYSLRSTSIAPLHSSTAMLENTNQGASVRTVQRRREAAPEAQSKTRPALAWAALESTNYFSYVENLRSIGCPEETIHDIIRADLHKLFSRSRTALLDGARPTQERGAEEAVLQALFGDRWWADDPMEPGAEEQNLSDLPPEKRGRLQTLGSTFDATEKAITERLLQSNFSSEELNQLREARKQRQEALEQLLTREELEAYQLRGSKVAPEFQQALAGLSLDRQTVLSVYRLREAFEVQYGSEIESVEESYLEARARAKEQLDGEFFKLLGEDGFSQFQQHLESPMP